MGRSKKPPIQNIIAEISDSYGIISDAANKLNVTRQTLATWIKGNPKLEEAQENAMRKLEDFAVGQLIKNVKDGKEASLMFLLKTKFGYREKDSLISIDNKQLNIKYILPEHTTEIEDIPTIQIEPPKNDNI